MAEHDMLELVLQMVQDIYCALCCVVWVQLIVVELT